jgi:DNA-binding transcriptional ArsR family regulator
MKHPRKKSRVVSHPATAAGACCSGPGPDVFLQPFFKVILDETRRHLIRFIGLNAGKTAGEIAAAFSLDRSTISHHLSVMTAHGFLTASKAGRNRRYRVNREYIVKTLEQITESIRTCCRECN